MTEDEQKSDDWTNLRKQADEVLKGKNTDLKTLSSDDVQSLIHELQVHQIELEMQNEDLRRVQNELEDSRNRYSDLYDFAPLGYFTFDKNGLILQLNLTGANKLGIERGNLIKTPFTLYIAPDFKDVFYLHLRQVFNTETQITCELRLVDKNGNQFDVQLESMPVCDIDGNLLARTAMSDITERKRMEKELQEKQKELDIIFNSVPAMIWSKNIEGKYLQVNRAYSETVGLSLEKILGRTDYDLYSTDLADQYSKYDQEINNSRKPVSGIEERHLKPSGDHGWSLTEKMPRCDAEGNVVGTIGFALDITKRKQAEEALRESEDRFRTIFDSVNDAVFIHDIETGAILDVNRTMCEMYGYSREEVDQLDIQAVSSGEVPYTQQAALEWNKKAAMGDAQVFEWMAKHKSGHIFWVEVSMKKAVIGLQERLLVVVRDI
ncbi:MAG: PAS domain-containing protein, partial [ANME-2 cluster archaeon]|nr:PAS domain-containing protein [ANME-2 cluster archaeon]